MRGRGRGRGQGGLPCMKHCILKATFRGVLALGVDKPGKQTGQLGTTRAITRCSNFVD